MWIELLKLVSSVLTPILVLLFGLKLSKALEQWKTGIAQQKDWSSKWADRFYCTADQFIREVEEFVHQYWEIAQTEKQKFPGWEGEIKCRAKRVHELSYSLQRSEWAMKNECAFVKDKGAAVLEAVRNIWQALESIQRENKGDLEDIRSKIFEFNRAFRAAHQELLRQKD